MRNISMKKIILLFFAFLIILPNAAALKGAGLQWYTESVQITEGTTQCVKYGVYNPWDEDITIGLQTSGEIAQFAKLPRPQFVPAGTMSSSAKRVEICFKIPKIYHKNCKLGSFMCEHDCSQKVTYSGEISATESAPASKAGGTGSATAASVASNLKIEVLCAEKSSAWMIVPAAVGLAILILLAALKWPTAQRKREKYISLFNDLEILRAELEGNPHHSEKRKRYKNLWSRLNKLKEKL